MNWQKRKAKKKARKKTESTKTTEWPDFGIRVRGRQAKGWFSNCSKTAKSDHSSRLAEENRAIANAGKAPMAVVRAGLPRWGAQNERYLHMKQNNVAI
jgi:hypothetical protein